MAVYLTCTVNKQHVMTWKQLASHSKCTTCNRCLSAEQMSPSLHLPTHVLQCPRAYNMRSLYFALLIFAAVTSSFASFVFDLDSRTFNHYMQDKDVMLVDFFAPWCQHCKNLAPELENAADILASKNQFVFAKVDCIAPQNEALCKKFNIQGYPSLKLFKFGQYSGDYIGGRTRNDLLAYMDSVTEANAQRAPLTSTGPASFAASLGASPQAYFNPLQFQQAPHPQAFQVPQPGQAVPSYFNGPLAAQNPGPSLVHSFYGGNQPANQPAVAPFANQPKVEAKAPTFHVGPSPDSAAKKFGGNVLALEILRAKLKMIAAYKNWQKRLKEYKLKMADAVQMNQNRAFTKHVIHKPNSAAALKAKAYLRKKQKPANRYQRKYPRTYRAPAYRPRVPYRPYGAAAFRRGSVYGRQGYRPAAYPRRQPYRQPYSAAYKRYFTFKQRQRQRVLEAQRRQKIQRQRQQQRQQQFQGYQQPYGRSFIAQPPQATQQVYDGAVQQEVSQADKASVIQTKPQETATVVSQPQPKSQEPAAQSLDQGTNANQDKTETPSSDSDKTSIKDLKSDIESAIKEALKSTGNTNVVNAVKIAPTAGTKTLDVSGSGSGQGSEASGSGEQHPDHDISGSGSGSDTSGSGSGDNANTSKKSDKPSGEP